VCPLCGKMIDDKANVGLPEDQRINYIVSQHIESGCKRFVIEMRKKKLCEFDECDEKRMMRCKKCRKWLCLKHRHQEDHDCESLEKNQKKSHGWSQALNPILARAREARRERAAKNSTTTSSISMGRKALDVFENSSGDPIGQKSIEMHDRVYLDVFLPYRSKKKPYHAFFSLKWPVGKVLDKIAAHGKLHNLNATTSDPSQRLVLYALPSGAPLPMSDKLQNCMDLGLIKKRGRTAVILEYGPSLNEEVQEMAVNVLNGKNSKVIDLTGDNSSDCVVQ